MNTNFGFSFGMPPAEDREGDGQSQEKINQESQDYSIDLDQITPPTFRFGQFGQAPLPDNGNAVNNNNNNNNGGDDDSFLAEPSISVGQFDASFNFHDSGSVESLPKSTSTTSVPTLIEEPLPQPDYLEEPAPHSVEDLFKATVDGSSAGIVLDDSWENVGIEEIEAAQAEFDAIKEAEINEAKVDSVIEESGTEEPKVAEPEHPVETEAESVTQEPVKEPNTIVAKVTKPKVTEKKPSAAAKVDTSFILSEGRAKRERKTVERLSEIVEPKSVKASVDKTPSIPKGSGTKLGDIEVIEKNLAKKLASDKHVSTLHRIIFDRVGEARTRKSNIRAFCGLEYSQEATSHFEPKLQKLTVSDLKALAQLLGLTGASEKAALVNKISTFLAKPNPEAVKAEKAPVKKVTATKKTTAAAAVKKKPAKRTAKKSTTSPATKKTKSNKILTPEIVDSDVESDVEREVLNELNNNEEN